MISRTDKFLAIYTLELKRNKWMSILLLCLLILACPGIILLSSLNGNINKGLEFSFKYLATPIIMLFTLIISVNIFKFMHNRGSIDLFNSLPLKRSTIFSAIYFCGLTLVLIPIIINFLMCLILCMQDNILLISVVHNFLYIILSTIASFTLTAFIAVCSGTAVDMIISTIVINLIYPVLINLMLFLASAILPGYNMTSIFTRTLTTAFSPYLSAFVPFINYTVSESYIYTNRTDMFFIIWWIIFIVIFFTASYSMYKKRKNEKTQLSFEYNFPVIIIKSMSILACSVGIGLIFLNFVKCTHISFWLGVILGGFIGYIMLESIYSRGFKNIFQHIKYYFIMILSLLLIYLLLIFGWMGYDKRISDESHIQSVEVRGDALDEVLKQYANLEDNYIIDGEKQELIGELKETASIQAVLNLHKMIVEGLKYSRGYPYKPIKDTNKADITITYNLKNGTKQTRTYSIEDYDDSTRKHASDIASLEEYKKQNRMIFNIDERDVAEIEIISVTNSSKNYKIDKTLNANLTERSEILNSLRQDILNDNCTKQYNWQANSGGTYTELIIYSHSDYYDNPDIKRTLFTPSHYIVPDYYEDTISTLVKFDLI